jgi:hypothetical protein
VVQDRAGVLGARRGVVFQEYDQPGLRTVDGIATTPVGRAAWFNDSEGNTLTKTQLGYKAIERRRTARNGMS